MIQPNVPVESLNPGLNGTPRLTNVDFTTFAGDAVDTSCFQYKVIHDRPKETCNLPRQEATLKWLKIKSYSRLLGTQRWTFEFHKCKDFSDRLSNYITFPRATLCCGVNQ
jgi:hypothetical protein